MSNFLKGQKIKWKSKKTGRLMPVVFVRDIPETFDYTIKNESVVYLYASKRAIVVSTHNLYLPIPQKYQVVCEVMAMDAKDAANNVKPLNVIRVSKV